MKVDHGLARLAEGRSPIGIVWIILQYIPEESTAVLSHIQNAAMLLLEVFGKGPQVSWQCLAFPLFTQHP